MKPYKIRTGWWLLSDPHCWIVTKRWVPKEGKGSPICADCGHRGRGGEVIGDPCSECGDPYLRMTERHVGYYCTIPQAIKGYIGAFIRNSEDDLHPALVTAVADMDRLEGELRGAIRDAS